MEILITGGTGLLGRALCAALLAKGHQLTVLSRHPERVAPLCGDQVKAMGSLNEWTADQHFDAVVNLAGAPLIDLPWTPQRKQILWHSRVTLTEELVAAMTRAKRKPAVLLSGSAIGVYGDAGDTLCSDIAASPVGEDYGARLCLSWEAAANQAKNLGVRVCLLRTGLVLAKQGGLLARMRAPFKMGLGMRLGNGGQWMSWIHIIDWVGAVCALLENESASGAFNLTAPHAVRNAEFTRVLAATVGKSEFCATPALLVRLAFGQRAYLLLSGQHVLPDKLQQLPYKFQFAELDHALQYVALLD